MREIGVRELKQSLSETLRAVGRGEHVRVTLRGRPLADIVPAGAAVADDRLRQLDASALVKRYVAEPGSEVVRDAMAEADGWYICRVGFVETVRAVGVAAGAPATKAVKDEWPAFAVVEVDQSL